MEPKKSKEFSNGKLEAKVSELFDNIAQLCRGTVVKEKVCLEDCLEFYQECKKENSAVAGFVLCVKKNEDPQSEDDNLIIMQGMIDAENRPIAIRGQSMSQQLHAKTVDQKIINLLDGEDIKIIKE